MKKQNAKFSISKVVVVIIIATFIALGYFKEINPLEQESSNLVNVNVDLSNIPEYTDKPYVYINNNIPYFAENEINVAEFEHYSNLDGLGRCGTAYASICKSIMPAENEERESISNVVPTGWKQVLYKGVIEGNYLYNRCHLIGYQLAGENANKKNLITGTRYMNTEGMLPFENMVAEYVKDNPKNHVLYRVTPIFKGNNLLASGVQIEAYSVEDSGKGICFNVYVYNVQPGILIDYSTGESKLSGK